MRRVPLDQQEEHECADEMDYDQLADRNQHRETPPQVEHGQQPFQRKLKQENHARKIAAKLPVQSKLRPLGKKREGKHYPRHPRVQSPENLEQPRRNPSQRQREP